MFGNTEAVAEEIAAGVATRFGVDVAEVSSAPRSIGGDVRLLIVGGPTHAFGMTRASTRRSAAEQAGRDLVSAGEGVREWLDSLSGGSPDVDAAAFDTRVRRPRLPGSAARGARKRLRRGGFRVIAPAVSFFVEGMTGPLSQGESQRARQWGEQIAARVTEKQR
nr:flavodoxin [Allosalinactinospora lopnorensis]